MTRWKYHDITQCLENILSENKWDNGDKSQAGRLTVGKIGKERGRIEGME